MMNRIGLDFDNWTNVQKLHLGVKMIGYVESLGLIRHQNRKTGKNKTITYVEATPKIIEEYNNDHNDKGHARSRSSDSIKVSNYSTL